MSRNIFCMIRLLIALSLLSLCILSCGDDSSDYDVFFKLEYDGEALVMLEEYDYPDGQKVKFTRFSFYASDIRVSNGSESQLIKEVDFLNLTDSHSRIELASTGYRMNLKDITIKDPTRLDFNIGVTADQNATIPANYTGDHPLAKPGEYWIGWESFIFFKIEGIMDTTGDGDTDTNIALHIGSDDMLRFTSVDLSADEDETEVVIDLQNIFSDGDVTYDILNDPQIHSLNQIAQAEFLIDNLQKQIK